MQRRPPKQPDLLQAIRAAIGNSDYSFTAHAQQRLLERDISPVEVLQVLQAGWHENAKDEFDEKYQRWSYAIRGRTPDDRKLRVAIGFDPTLHIITVIDLDA